MKNLIISISYVLLFSVFSIQATMQTDKVDKRASKKNETLDAKCHVALIDGSETIIFFHIYSDQFPKLSNDIVGKRVQTQKSVERIKVYRVYECVLDEDNFTKDSSKALDKKIER